MKNVTDQMFISCITTTGDYAPPGYTLVQRTEVDGVFYSQWLKDVTGEIAPTLSFNPAVTVKHE